MVEAAASDSILLKGEKKNQTLIPHDGVTSVGGGRADPQTDG
jgi:hypothetical protein